MSSKTTLCMLLSEQHVPNLLSVHHFQPDELLLLESEGMKRRESSTKLLNALLIGGLDYSKRYRIQPVSNVNDFPALRSDILSAITKGKGTDWIVNISGGTKPMAIVAHECFQRAGAKIVYVDVARPSTFLDVSTGEAEHAEYQISIDEFLAGYGFRQRTKPQVLKAKAAGAARRWDATVKIARFGTTEPLFKGNPDRRSLVQKMKGRFRLEPGEVCPGHLEIRQALISSLELEQRGKSLAGEIDSNIGTYLAGGWLEEFFWGLLSRHAAAFGIWDVRIGVTPGIPRAKNVNEIDVAFMRDNRLHMIECKSGRQRHDQKFEILYKVEAITRQFRALGVRSFLATTTTDIFENGKIKQHLQERAQMYHCRLLTYRQIKRMAQKHDSAQSIGDILFGQGS